MKLVEVLSPASVLSRGYSITRVNGKAIISAAQVAPDDIITTTLARGTLHSKITPTQ